MLSLGVFLLALAAAQPGKAQNAPVLSPIEPLGKALYFDEHLSKNANQSCATCHDPEAGDTGSDSTVNAQGAVYPGSDPTLNGNRKPRYGQHEHGLLPDDEQRRNQRYSDDGLRDERCGDDQWRDGGYDEYARHVIVGHDDVGHEYAGNRRAG